MKKTGIKAAIIIVLAVTVLASQAFAGPGGGGRGGSGWGRGMADRPRMGANLKSVQTDGLWRPGGPYCPFAQGPYQNIRGRQGRGMAMQGRGGRGYQGRGAAIQGRGYQGRGMAMQGRAGRGFQGIDTAPQGWRITGRRGQFGPGGISRKGPGMQPRRFAPGDTGRPMPPRSRAWAPRSGMGWRQGWAPDRGQGWRPNPQPEKVPDTNVPQGWRMNSSRGQPGPGGISRPGQGMQQRRFTPEDTDQTNQPTPPRGRNWAPGMGAGRRQGMGPGLGWGPGMQPEKAPDANAPKLPIVEDQPEKPQGE
jgi:hypothetical protein